MDNSEVASSVIFKEKQVMKDNISFFNNLMNRVLRALKLVCIDWHDFKSTCGHAVPNQRLEIWPGYVTAIIELEGRLKLIINATHAVMR